MKALKRFWLNFVVLILLALLTSAFVSGGPTPVANLMMAGENAGTLPGWVAWLMLGTALVLSFGGWVWYRQKKT